MNKALFIILDETLITPRSGKSFPINSSDWKFTANFYDLFKNAIDKDYIIVIIDNQLGIGEGLIIESVFITKVEQICSTIEKDLKLKNNKILYSYCANMDDEFRVKPNPGMLYELALDNNILLSSSVLIGNNKVDEHFSFIGGIPTYYNLPQIPFIKL